MPNGTICRESSGACDPAEYCTGLVKTCPADVVSPNGTVCDDGNACTGTSYCNNTVCSGVDIYCVGVCGDGTVASGEECDDGISTDCCENCKFKNSSVICRPADPEDICMPAQYCSGTSGTCAPTVRHCPVCLNNCSNHGECVADGECVCDLGWTLSDCSEPVCDIYSTCSNCTTNSGCGWCCSASGGGSCVKGDASGPKATCGADYQWQYGSCGCNVTCQQGGSCVCGSCDCLSGTGGNDCSKVWTCEGYYIPANETAHHLDQCGVCNGNGSSCLGCDGISTYYFKKYDKCGVCGGDGTSCYGVCNYDSCSSCTLADKCVWCGGEKKCVQKTDTKTVCTNKKTSCSSSNFLGPIGTTGAAIGGGVIAAIVIAIVIAVAISVFGGRKTYQLIKESQNRKLAGVSNNPLYEEAPENGVNPLYEQRHTEMETLN